MDMMETISLVICALAFGGIVQKIGCLDTIIESILKHCKTRGSIILSNVITCIAMNFLTAYHYMATLGVNAFQYGRYYISRLIVPIISIIYGFTGFKLERLNSNTPISNYIYEPTP